jgi:hypothetical protein
MSLSTKLTAAVDKAFTAAGDLVKTATLSDKAVSGYDFSTGTATSTSKTVTVDIILFTKSLPSGGGYSVEGIMKSSSAIDVNVYDTITVGSDSYNIVNAADDGFAITLQLKKEK